MHHIRALERAFGLVHLKMVYGYGQIRGLKENVFFKNVSNFDAKNPAKNKFYNVQEDALVR